MSQKPCPKYDCQISEKATVCPVCKINLSSRSFAEKLLGLRDYMTFPAAVLALIAALFSPINETVRQTLG